MVPVIITTTSLYPSSTLRTSNIALLVGLVSNAGRIIEIGDIKFSCDSQ
jgi:hypothetical protein